MKDNEVKIEFDPKNQVIKVNGTKYEINATLSHELDEFEKTLDLKKLTKDDRDILIKDATEKIVEKIKDPKAFVKGVVQEALKMESRKTLRDITERLGNERASVEPHFHCYALMIGGKRGPPHQLDIAGV